MTGDLEKAKQMFWDYACSHFHLDRDGAKQEYRDLGGSGKYEPQWRAEYIDHWVSRLDISDLTALRQLDVAHAYEALPSLLEIVDYGDDYSKFWYAFTIAELSRSTKDRKEIREAGIERAISLWMEILNNPSGISAEHRREVDKFMLESLSAKNAEEYVRNYTASKLKEFA